MTTQLCEEGHTCSRCGDSAWCGTYLWACPWLNGDENTYCEPCAKVLEVEEQAAWEAS